MLSTIPNREASIKKLVARLGAPESWKACYEAGPTGYEFYWSPTKLGCRCEEVALTLMPAKADDRVKADHQDVERLARGIHTGDLTAVWIPDVTREALQDLVRAREAAKQDQTRALHRLGKFLLRHGPRPVVKMKAWTKQYLEWIRTEVCFEQYAQ